jgi:hypothetical protein
MRQPIELHRLPIGGRAHQRDVISGTASDRHRHRARESDIRAIVGGFHQLLDELHAASAANISGGTPSACRMISIIV